MVCVHLHNSECLSGQSVALYISERFRYIYVPYFFRNLMTFVAQLGHVLPEIFSFLGTPTFKGLYIQLAHTNNGPIQTRGLLRQ